LETKADILYQAFTEKDEFDGDTEVGGGTLKLRSNSPFKDTASYFEDRQTFHRRK
jgi:hypothetical protein